MDDATDNQLIAAHLRGDDTALQRLVDRHLPAVSGFCFQLALKRPLAEDLTQETFLRAIRSLSSFRGGSAFRTWLFSIASNLAKNRLARDSRETAVGNQVDELTTPVTDAPDQSALQSELAEEIDAALEELPLNLRSALVLSVVHGMPSPAIAEIEGVAVNTIYWRIHEARKILKRRLQQWTT
ncbi:RNA polymerase sigma factor [Anatilimnocola floriformis]|uniref:RNA polymerase sigma factor n=1 Tax=Anatilimnocola floriformis TaxID=2948575 RepID=UPI0020C1D866|nr:RNA polymerase sigma factor [Anatilimnocola floriformis]